MSEQLIQVPGSFGENGNLFLERELGTGGMGGVYMGRDKMLDRPIAVKVMLKELGGDAEFVNRFKREAQSVAKLIHPNIAQVYSYGICDGMPYIAMELASGGSLYSLMNANPGKTDIPRVIKICQQVAQALQCASDQGFVHGDVKPENILLDANGNAKLVDFGLAAMQKDTTEIWGTPYYISPEKVKKEPVDYRADMYSLGGTLYHALTGVAPFEGEDSISVVKKRFDGMPKKPSEIRAEISPAIDNLVMQMLAFRKEDRFPSFEALLDAFKKVLTTGLTSKTVRKTTLKRKINLNTAAINDGIPKRLEKPKETEEEDENIGRKVLIYVVGGALAIGLVIGGLYLYSASADKEKLALEQQQVETALANARISVTNTVDKAVRFGAEIETMAKEAMDSCQSAEKEIRKVVTDIPEGSAMAATLKELWDRANNCKTGIVSVTSGVQEIVEKAKGAGAITGRTKDDAQKLTDVANEIVEKFTQIKTSKDVESIRKARKFIDDKGKKTLDEAIRQMKLEKLKAERQAAAEAAAEAEKERLRQLADAKKARIEEETAAIKAKFEAVSAQGCFRQLDWKSAFRQLETMKSEFKTAEGQLAADVEIHKVRSMKAVQDVFLAGLKGHVFRNKPLKGARVVSTTEVEITYVKPDKAIVKMRWPKFYKECPNNLNEIINAYIVNARLPTAEHKLNLREWADAMMGSALTMRLICSDVVGANERAQELVKEIVKQFPEYQKTVQEIFPDVTVE